MKLTTKYFRWRLCFVVFLAGICLGCDSVVAQTKDNEVTVRILLFSGRPDPTFQLTEPDQIKRLNDLLDAARLSGEVKTEKDSAIPAKLGYKGIVIQNLDKAHGMPSHIAVFDGLIELKSNGKHFFNDSQGQLETMLLNMAIQRGLIPEKIQKRLKQEGNH